MILSTTVKFDRNLHSSFAFFADQLAYRFQIENAIHESLNRIISNDHLLRVFVL